MNKLFLLALAALITVASHAQTERNPYPKTISVTGSSELEIIPDEIYVQVELKEYEKKGQSKTNIDRIKQDFLAHIKRMGIPDSLITIAAYDGYNGNPWLRKKNKKEELLASITYQLKLKSSQQMDELVNGLDDNATSNFQIIRTSHSRIQEIRKQLKIQAVKAAKEKAGYLASAIDEKVGVAISINEPNESFIPYYNTRMTANVMMKDGAGQEEQVNVDFTKIKFRYEVTVVFSLQ